MDEFSLMRLRPELLFHHDEYGRITGTNEPPPPGPAPRLWVGRTTAGIVWRFRDDLPDDLTNDLNRTLCEEPRATNLEQPLAARDQLIQLLAGNAPVESTWEGPAWRFPTSIPLLSGIVVIERPNAHLVRKHFGMLADEIGERQPCFAVVEDGVAVSVCFSARNAEHAAEAGVDTVEAFRGRGYAVAATAGWATAVRRSGRKPLYSTSWDNFASRRIASKLGLVLYGADFSVT